MAVVFFLRQICRLSAHGYAPNNLCSCLSFVYLLFSKLLNYVSGLLLQMSAVVAGDHRGTLSTGLLSPCLLLSRTCVRGKGAGASVAVLHHGVIPGKGEFPAGQ